MDTIENIKISGQANMIIKQMNDFPIAEFIKWWKEEKVIIAGGHVIEFMEKVLSKKGGK